MLAKIAHSYTYAELGPDGFIPVLSTFVLGSQPRSWQFIGSGIGIEPLSENLHDLAREVRTLKDGRKVIVVRIRLFAQYSVPTHYVVSGFLANY